jgi:predicted amidophosphoribosyltransferase
MSLAKETRKCPYCRESIDPAASRCKHCHGDLVDRGRSSRSFWKTLNTFRTGFLCGLLFMTILIGLAYFQFFAGN